MVPHGNRLILVGGFSATNELGEPHHLISHPFVSMFDTETEQWSELPALPQGRSSHDAVVIDNNLYVVGGWCMDGPDSTEWHDSALVMDLTATSPEWNSIPAPGFQRRALALAAYQNKLVAIGGMTPQAGPTREVSFYDPEQQQWQAGPELQGSQGMVGFGASAYELNGQLVATTFDGSIQVLAADNSRWQTTGQTEDARFFHRLLPLDSNRLVNIGGANMESGKFLTPEPVPVKTATPGDPK
jgi:N-acetylneuraminic acid mutarotase